MNERQITAAAELDALPVGSVILDLGTDRSLADSPVIACKAARGDWTVMGEDPEQRWWSHEMIETAAAGNVLVVVHEP